VYAFPDGGISVGEKASEKDSGNNAVDGDADGFAGHAAGSRSSAAIGANHYGIKHYKIAP
jgi:hypothetical protein